MVGYNVEISYKFVIMRLFITSVLTSSLFALFFISCKGKETPQKTKQRSLDSLLVDFPDSVTLLLERGNNSFDASNMI